MKFYVRRTNSISQYQTNKKPKKKQLTVKCSMEFDSRFFVIPVFYVYQVLFKHLAVSIAVIVVVLCTSTQLTFTYLLLNVQR